MANNIKSATEVQAAAPAECTGTVLAGCQWDFAFVKQCKYRGRSASSYSECRRSGSHVSEQLRIYLAGLLFEQDRVRPRGASYEGVDTVVVG